MKRFLLVALALTLGSCSSWITIGYQNATALNLDCVLFSDVQALANGKLAAPPVAYDATLYARVYADINNCEVVYNTIPKSGLSLGQLGLLKTSIEMFRLRDSMGASKAFFEINAPMLDSTASEIRNLEISKLVQP
jgi:hypothetical protein